MKDDEPPASAAEAAGCVMALDWGRKRIGIALSDPLGLSARPLMTLARSSWESDLGVIRRVVREQAVRRIVVGLPLDMDGERGAQARRVEAFMRRVQSATGLPVVAWDERLTTVQAERALQEGNVRRSRRRQVMDQVAAVILLQAYLDAHPAAAR
ncbi:MAG TPA: Holliday junction resolvase RuvX [Candidatus Polarisedimenticolia bacterium]|nr:Holliday junction resolvase RuvX [Candidatus Polarisedimenticolia bacterium]